MNITAQSAADRKAMSFAMNLSLGVGLLMLVMKMGAYLLTGSSAMRMSALPIVRTNLASMSARPSTKSVN